MAAMALDVLVRLRDQLSGPLRALRNNLRSLANFGRQIGILGAAIGAISFMQPIKEAAAFQQQLLDIAGTAELTGNAAFTFVDQQKAAYEELSFVVAQTSQTIAEGAGQMIAAGVAQDLIDRNIATIGKTATAANAEFSDLSAVATSLLNTLKVPETELEGALAGLVVAGKMGAFELKDMARYFPQLTGQLRKFGITGREASDQIASLLQIARMGTSDPGQAANNLNNFLSKALAPVTVKNFKEAGVDIEAVMMDAVAKGINPVEAMLQKVGVLTGASGEQIAKYMGEAKKRGLEGADAFGFVRDQLEAIGAAGKLGELFGDQQVLDFLIPMMANIEEYKRIKAEVSAATGSVIDADFETQMAGINRQLMIFGEIGTQMVREIGLSFGQWLPSINENLIAFLGWLRQFDKESGGLVKKTLSFAGVGLIAAAALGTLGFVLPIIGAGLSALGAAAALVVSPIGLLAAAGGAAALHIYRNWDRYGPRVRRAWAELRDGARDLGRGAQRMWRDFMAGARPAMSGIGRAIGSIVGDLRGIGRSVGNLLSDIVAMFDRLPPLKLDIDLGQAGGLLGTALKAAADDTARFVSDVRALVDAGSELTAWLRSADPGSWSRILPDGAMTVIRGLVNPFAAVADAARRLSSALGMAPAGGLTNLIPDAAFRVVKDLANPIQTVARSARELIDALTGKATANWSVTLPPWVIWVANMIGAAVNWVADGVGKLLSLLASVSVDWDSLIPKGIAGTAQAIAGGINAIVGAINSLKEAASGLTLNNLLPDVGAANGAAKAGADVGNLAGPKPPSGGQVNKGGSVGARDGVVPGKQSSLGGDGLTKIAAAVQRPVRLDGAVSVSIKVDGPGKVASVNSNSPNVTARAGNGRVPGTV